MTFKTWSFNTATDKTFKADSIVCDGIPFDICLTAKQRKVTSSGVAVAQATSSVPIPGETMAPVDSSTCYIK